MESRTFNLFIARATRFFKQPLYLPPGGGVKFKMPGIAYSDLTRTGIPAPWQLLKSLETVWFLKYLQSGVKTMPEPPMSEAPLVAICSRLHIAEAFYNRLELSEVIQYSALPGPSRGKIFSLAINYRHSEDEALLVDNLRQFCYLHPEKRTSIPISGEHLRNASPHELVRLHVLPVPVSHFRCTLRVTHSDTDYYGHVNQSQYLRFCLDSAAEAVAAGELRR